MAKDKYHEQVKRALEKDGWIITHDPYILRVEGFRPLPVDLGAEKLIAATKGKDKIAVEIKTFPGLSQITDFYGALGKFRFYAPMLVHQEPDRVLYLAVPLVAWKTFFSKEAVQEVVEINNLKIFVYEPHKEEIVLWT